MKSTREIFYGHTGKLIHKWDHYFEIYDRYFSKYIGEKVNILEIGIAHGGSIQMWKEYFGNQVHVYAIDINPACKELEEENTTIFIGSQSDADFLEKLKKEIPELDIVLDDGGHSMIQQKVSFNCLFSKVKEGGVYMVEDTHTSYWYEFFGGYKNKNSFIEFSKNLIDSLYDGHIKNEPKLISNEITRNINSISFYDSIIVFEKKYRNPPFHLQKGHETINMMDDPTLRKLSIWEQVKKKFYGKNHETFVTNFKGKI